MQRTIAGLSHAGIWERGERYQVPRVTFLPLLRHI